MDVYEVMIYIMDIYKYDMCYIYDIYYGYIQIFLLPSYYYINIYIYYYYIDTYMYIDIYP